MKNTIFLAITALSAYVWLAHYSLPQEGYDTREIERLNEMAVAEDDYLSRLEVTLWKK